MALFLELLMVHAAVGRTLLRGHDQGADLVLLQQRVQKLESEHQHNSSHGKKLGPAFEKAMFDTQTDKMAFDQIEKEVDEWEKVFMEEQHMLFESYKQTLEAQENKTKAARKRNRDLKSELEEKDKLNDERMQKAQHLKEESLQLAYDVRLLRGEFSNAMDRASAALDSADAGLADPSLEALFQKEAPHDQTMALLGLDTQKWSKDTHIVPAQKTSKEVMKSLQDLLSEIISRQNASNAKVQAAFEKEMTASVRERSRFLKENAGMTKKLEEAKAKGVKLEDAIHYLETTQQGLLSVRSSLRQVSTADEAAIKAAPVVQAAPVAQPVVDEVASAKWAVLAFQIRGNQDDYDKVLAASDPEGTYDVLKNGPDFWATQAAQFTGNQADRDRIMAVEPMRRKVAYEALTRGEPFTFGPAENAEKPLDYSSSVAKDEAAP